MFDHNILIPGKEPIIFVGTYISHLQKIFFEYSCKFEEKSIMFN